MTRAAEAETEFVPVASSLSTSGAPALAVVIGESRIEVCAGFDPSLLRAVVSALGAGAR